MIEKDIVNIVYDLFNPKYNYINYDLCNYICEYIVDPSCNIRVHYEKNVKKEIKPCNKTLNTTNFMHGFVKCILHKKYELNETSIIPYWRRDIHYFTNNKFYKKELSHFIKYNPLIYLQIYQEVINYVNSYSTAIDLGDNNKFYVIYYYNKENSLDKILNKFINISNPYVFQ